MSEALRLLVQGVATATGKDFFAVLVENLAKALGTHGAWVTEYLPEARRLRALAFWLGGRWVPNYEHDIDGTPCQGVVDGAELVHYPDRILDLFPRERDLMEVGAVSYMGIPLKSSTGDVLGHLAVLDTRPMPPDPNAVAFFRIFAARASAELERLRAEAKIRQSEERLRGLFDSVMDAIIELDGSRCIDSLNPAAEKALKLTGTEARHQPFSRFLNETDRAHFEKMAEEVESRPPGERYLWLPGGLTPKNSDGTSFRAEATLSCYEVRKERRFTLILRDVNDRIEAERKMESLSQEAAYLREQIRELRDFDRIIGTSPPMMRLLRDVAQVAHTGTTVLILGETGTGKELIAHAIHSASSRRSGPLVRVNCAAVPATLMESEFFGHERGAFTGATTRRLGRFVLADRGTLFLDEVGELPLELQAKLLRVLQEGELEPVGSSKTHKVDVRIIAATNRDLQAEVRAGRFREDLFYRLHVFPLQVPPLRDRSDDIPLLAEDFARKFAQQLGTTFAPLTPACVARLKAYTWPGNVRELANVIERAAITSRGGCLNLDRALPESVESTSLPPAPEEQPAVRTAKELAAMERRNLMTALEQAGWRVAGAQGAAAMLGIAPSTFSSRMKALGIVRPRG